MSKVVKVNDKHDLVKTGTKLEIVVHVKEN